MLTIRLSRTGKKGQPSYRVVLAEHSWAVKGKFLEILGNYNPVDKHTVLEKERILYWIKQGAQPSDTFASLAVKNGMKELASYLPKEVK